MNISPETTRLGWIGTGVMGHSMCGHLIDAGYPMTIYSRTRSKAVDLLAKGASWVNTPRAVAEAADVVCSIVGFPADVEEVLLGSTGALSGCQAGNILVDFTTSKPSLAAKIAEAASAKQVEAVDAPVSGGDVGAREGRLSIMIGGNKEVVDSLEPIFQTVGAKSVWQGGPGAGQHTKMVNQTLIASNMVAVCEGLLYAHQAGLDLETVMESVSSGAAGSWSLSNLGARMIAGNYDPGFFVEHFIKDMGIALEEARRMGISLPGLALAEQLYIGLASQGHRRSGTQALILALAKLSNIDWEKRA